MAGVILQRWLWSEEKGDYDKINFRPRWIYSADSLSFESKFADMDSVLVKFSKQLSETFETTTIRPCFTSSAKWYSEQALE